MDSHFSSWTGWVWLSRFEESMSQIALSLFGFLIRSFLKIGKFNYQVDLRITLNFMNEKREQRLTERESNAPTCHCRKQCDALFWKHPPFGIHLRILVVNSLSLFFLCTYQSFPVTCLSKQMLLLFV